MKILIEDFELIYSSTVIQIKNYPIKVILPDEIEGDFTFIFNFSNNAEERKPIAKFNNIDKFTISIDLINFESAPIIGNSELIEVGTLKKNPLFLQYRVSNLNVSGKTIIINFFIRKERKNA